MVGEDARTVERPHLGRHQSLRPGAEAASMLSGSASEITLNT